MVTLVFVIDLYFTPHIEQINAEGRRDGGMDEQLY